MAGEKYRDKPWPSRDMPPGIPFIIGNEAAERFSFYGMRTILVVFMVKYLWLMGDTPGEPMSGAEASERYHMFTGFVYLTPFIGAMLADFFFGKYRVIIWLSLIYCLGHGALALMGFVGKAEMWLSLGLWLIIFGSGGIKPCVSAHVGDQFGTGNQHLLTKIFNWFYFSINLGAFVSSLLTPWLLEWYGPHIAFGVPGLLMLIATICFWSGRYRFVHIEAKSAVRDIVSAGGRLQSQVGNWISFSVVAAAMVILLVAVVLIFNELIGRVFGDPVTIRSLSKVEIITIGLGLLLLFVRKSYFAATYRSLKELIKWEWVSALLKLSIIYLFVAMFWALFDQTGSSWVLQAEDMDRKFLGITWLPSQIQALNPILILTFIPLFTYFLYPAVDKVFKLTPLRKIGGGLFIMVIAFAVVAFAQEKIDAGGSPSISWQLIAYVIITASEVMVSIVCLEFSYTQAPRPMKSFVMALFFGSVFLGNIFTAKVNKLIQVKQPPGLVWNEMNSDSKRIAGYDQITGTADDIEIIDEDEMVFAGKEQLDSLLERLQKEISDNQYEALKADEGNAIVGAVMDPWGNPYRYSMINRLRCRITSTGPDEKYMTRWDQGAILQMNLPKSDDQKESWLSVLHPESSWIEKRKAELGIQTEAEKVESGASITTEYFVGGQIKLEGAPYFWFFTKVMLAAAILFLIVALFYKPRTYIYEDDEDSPDRQ
ncbi:MAG: POT family MFS transporter [Verrucomicrobiales bacterium]|nr:POT family MFS transporter [Verrucomicrobiales bacterium]